MVERARGCEAEGPITRDQFAELASFRKALRKFLRFVENSARMAGLTPQQHQALLALRADRDRDWATVGEIADTLFVQHNTAVGLLDRCHSLGLIERTRDANDRRVVRVSLTEEGIRVLEEITRRNLVEIQAFGHVTQEMEHLMKLRPNVAE